jgi:cytoskeletal protein RodZ
MIGADGRRLDARASDRAPATAVCGPARATRTLAVSVFEIGSALSQARHRLGLELAQVEQQTKLRAHYLRALEQEQFDQLPPGYRRSFLRSYATFLGLDADLLVDEYAARYETHEEPHATESVPRPVLRSRRRRPWGVLALGIVALVLAGVAAAVLLVYDRGNTNAQLGSPPTSTATQSTHARVTTAPHRKTTKRTTTPAKPKPRVVSVTITAVAGRCWVSVRKGSAQGPLAYEGTLEQGQTVNLRGSRYWARLGAPSALSLTVAGKAQTLPTHVSNVWIDAAGVSVAP